MDHIHSNTMEDVRIPGRHLSLEERGMIQALHRQGLSLRDIAAAVGCAHTTVFYELRRGTPDRKSKHGRAPQYMAKRGQQAYAENRMVLLYAQSLLLTTGSGKILSPLSAFLPLGDVVDISFVSVDCCG